MTAPAYSLVHGEMVRELEGDEFTAAESLLKLTFDARPHGVLSHEGNPLVYVPNPPKHFPLSADEADAWALLFGRAADEARQLVANRERDAFDGVPEERE